MTTRIRAGLRDRMIDAARAARPREACGLLIGGSVGDVTSVEVVEVVDNVATDRTAFELDPIEFAQVEASARASDRAVVGVWHSHATASAEPSERDRTGAWSDLVHVIVAAASRDIRAWRLVDSAFVEDDVVG